MTDVGDFSSLQPQGTSINNLVHDTDLNRAFALWIILKC